MRSGLGPAPGARQPPALPVAVGGHGAHRLDQVVDVGVERREVAAGPGGDPAAEGRVLERLREVAQGEAVLAELVLEARPGRAGLDPGRLRDRVDLEHPVHPPQVDRDDAAVVLPHPRLDAADHAGASAVGDRRRLSSAHQFRTRPRPPRTRGRRPGRAGSGTRRGSRGRHRGRPCRARGRSGRSGRPRRSRRARFGGLRRGSGSSTASSGTGSSISSTSKPSRSVTAVRCPST